MSSDGWTFEVEVVSANAFRVTGRDRVGHQVQRAGSNPDALLEQCKQDAADFCKPAAGN